MKLLFDQNISPKILKKLPPAFSECQQLRFVQLEDAADFDIFKFAKNNEFTIVTFDSDFLDLNALHGTPPKIIYLNTGNLTTKNITDLILNHIIAITQYLESQTDDILELIENQ